jgi:hypothetical protein
MAIGVSKLTTGGAQRYVNVGTVGAVNGTAGVQVGASIKLYLITVKDTGASAIDLRAEDDADNEVFEAVIRALPVGTIAYYGANASTGVISVIVDGVNAPAASVVQTTLRALGSAVGTNLVDVTGTTVADGTAFTVA